METAETYLTSRQHTIPIYDYIAGSTIIDLGANVGGMIETFLQYNPKRVYGFEAGENLCKQLKERFKEELNSDQVIIEQYAISDEDSILENVTWLNAWCIGDPKEMEMIASPDAVSIEGSELVNIKTIALDSYFKDIVMDRLDFIKVDIDGYEYKALKGAQGLINKFRPYIMIELSYYIEKVKGSSVKKFIDLIKEMNYEFVTVDCQICSADFVLQEFPWHTSCDMVLVPKEKVSMFKAPLVFYK